MANDFLGMERDEAQGPGAVADYLGANVPGGLDARSGLQDQGARLALDEPTQFDPLEGGGAFNAQDRLGGEGASGQQQGGGTSEFSKWLQGAMGIGGALDKVRRLPGRGGDSSATPTAPRPGGAPTDGMTVEGILADLDAAGFSGVTPEQVQAAFDNGAWPIGENPGQVLDSYGDVGGAAGWDPGGPLTGAEGYVPGQGLDVDMSPIATPGGDWLQGNAGTLGSAGGAVLGGVGAATDTPELGTAGQGVSLVGNLYSGNYLGALADAIAMAAGASGDSDATEAATVYGSVLSGTGPLTYWLGDMAGKFAGQFDGGAPSPEEVFATEMMPFIDPATKSLAPLEQATDLFPDLLERARLVGQGPAYVDVNAHDYQPGVTEQQYRDTRGGNPWGEYTDEGMGILDKLKADWIKKAEQQGGVWQPGTDGGQMLTPFSGMGTWNPELRRNVFPEQGALARDMNAATFYDMATEALRARDAGTDQYSLSQITGGDSDAGSSPSTGIGITGTVGEGMGLSSGVAGAGPDTGVPGESGEGDAGDAGDAGSGEGDAGDS